MALRASARLTGVVVLGLLWATRSLAESAGPAVHTEFPVPPAVRHQVEFWRDVFAVYSRRQVIIHDTVRLDRVYSVLDFRDLAAAGLGDAQIEQLAAQSEKREKARIRAVLLRLHRAGDNPTGLTPEEQRVWDLFRGVEDSRKFLHAAAEDRIRGQTGLKERFATGIEIAHRYLPEMEAIFREEGVPVEITRLALVESCFNVRAYSKRGAAGIWQFIPATGRLFMRIDDVVDERRDPILSTRAAARYLWRNYIELGTWPLAITAYNHGPAGIARAVREVGTPDITAIIARYRGPAFKFASRNFYPEFLAALEVERNHREHFGPLNLQRPVPTEVVRPDHFIQLSTAAECAGVEPEVLADLNPSLSRDVYDGKRRIPRGYPLRLPAGVRARFQRQYAALSPHKKFAAQRPLYVVHRVRRGQTLGAIARRYGRTVEQIRRHNNIRNRNFLREGQLLQIPAG